MDPRPPGSARRARERVAADVPKGINSAPLTVLGRMDDEPQMAQPSAPRQPAMGSAGGQPRAARPQAPFALQTKDGQIGVAISNPTRVPQWPLQERIMTPAQLDGEPFRPPPGKPQPPQRPPRPSRVPSILDASKVQDHTPVFQYTPQSSRESADQELLAAAVTPPDPLRSSTVSSIGTIPDFPLPIQVPAGFPRKNVNLGPPPSARRGASSFYSKPAFVSPIPEESPRSRPHASFASSAAMPDRWGATSPGPSPGYPDPIYNETIMEERSVDGDDDAEESRLVRSASIGKRARPTLVTATAREQRPAPKPVQIDPFKDGTGYLENSSSSGTTSTAAWPPVGSTVTADNILGAFASASAGDPSSPSQRTTSSPSPVGGGSYSRLSAFRRPPRLDVDAVRKAESRGSLTSLPDLIRRATRLASSLERGRRPASRFDDLDDYPGGDFDGVGGEKHRSGLSDMLAAFPPPAHPSTAHTRRSFRDSFRDQVHSWPLSINFSRSHNTSRHDGVPDDDSQRSGPKPARRCFGLPLWGFILMLTAGLIMIVAAIVIPIEFLVVRKQDFNNGGQESLPECRRRLLCANGGTNVVDQGVCSCICTNGFTGIDCTVADDTGCTAISLTGAMNLNDVTVGDAIPRLFQEAQANFSIPLSGSEILAKLNAGNLSCSAENALVTFDGRATRQGAAISAQAIDQGAAVVNGILYTTITIMVGTFTTLTVGNPVASATSVQASITSAVSATVVGGGGASPDDSPTATSTIRTTVPLSSETPLPSTAFAVTEEVLDFARVAVLYILQENSLADAETAQVQLQKLFTSASQAASSSSEGVSVEAARNVTVGTGKSVDLVDLFVDVG
ncbi:hypothetical protein BT67DRAFT_362078, partial [Trichocladium antarcticum]